MWRKSRWLNVVPASAAVFATGCSSSSVQLLKRGDAHVCTKSDVTEQLFEIIRQNVSMPDYGKLFSDESDRLTNWMNQVSFKVDSVTSKDINPSSERITCSATVHMSSQGVKQERSSNVDYQVVADLSNNKPMVSVSVGFAGGALGQIIQIIAAPEIREAQDKKDAADDAKIQGYAKQWMQNHRSDVAAMRSTIENIYSTESSPALGEESLPREMWQHSKLFSPAERAVIMHEEVLRAVCNASMSMEDHSVCDSQLIKYDAQLSKKDFCNSVNYGGRHIDDWQHCLKYVPPAAVDPRNTGSSGALSIGPFTPTEAAMVYQAEKLFDRCKGPEYAINPNVCDQSQAVVDKLRLMNICYGPDSAFEADKHWARCSAR